jgi:hypothetical protein
MSVPQACPYNGWDLYIDETWDSLYGSEGGRTLLEFYHGVIEALIEHFERNELLKKVVRGTLYLGNNEILVF